MLRVLAGLVAILLASGTPATAQQPFPTKPLRIVVPYGPGGSADQVARLYAEKLSSALGQQVIIENKPGASGGVGAQIVAAAPPDGYTLLLATTAMLAITPAVRKVTYEPADLAAVSRLSTPLLVVTITNELGAKTWPEFVTLAKANPGKYWFGSSGLGTITHLTGEVLTRAAGIQMQHAPYKTIVDAVGDVMSGRIHMVFDPSFLQPAKAGKVRAVLVLDRERMAEIPQTPTADEVGLDLKGFQDRSWFGLFGPKGMPKEVVERISSTLGKIAQMPELQRNLLLVAQRAHHQPHDAFARQVGDDMAYYAALLRELNIRLD